MAIDIGRRQLMSALGGAVVPWPELAQAQQSGQIRRIGVLMNLAADDPEATDRLGAFLQGMQELGWKVGSNVRIDTRWGAGDIDRYRAYAAELVALAPDVVLAGNGPIAGILEKASRTVPIVFANAVDPVSGGWVASLARPGGNATGFTSFELGTSTKWLELLKQIAPGVTRVALLRDPTTPAGSGEFGAIQAVAPSFGVELSPIDVREDAEIERAVAAFALGANGGLIVASGSLGQIHRQIIIALAARHRLPAVYPFRFFATSGGLIAYGPDQVDPFRRAAGYVDRILKGEKPADLPVQAATKFELVINLKTAKALGVTVPPALLTTADEVIE
jgi:putative ABC transport system substrate-binding protein